MLLSFFLEGSQGLCCALKLLSACQQACNEFLDIFSAILFATLMCWFRLCGTSHERLSKQDRLVTQIPPAGLRRWD